MSAKKSRRTLGKIIASAPTHAKRWDAAAIGGLAASVIQQLAFDAYGLRRRSLQGPDWQRDAIAALKARFADTLFPALMRDDRVAFRELVEAMGDSIRHRGNIADFQYSRGTTGESERSKEKRETGRRLRLALLSMEPEDRASMSAVLRFLEKHNVTFSDESHVRRVMREIKVRLLIPGQKCVWYTGNKFDKPVRILVVGKRGKLKNLGLSREDLYSNYGTRRYVELFPDK